MGAFALSGRIDGCACFEFPGDTSWASLARLAFRDRVDERVRQLWPVHQPDLAGSRTVPNVGLNVARQWLPDLGPIDSDFAPIRLDGYFRDGDGSIYWWLSTVLPGFRQFRFPAKLITFTALALAGLAGLGWDRVSSGRARGTIAVFCVLLA